MQYLIREMAQKHVPLFLRDILMVTEDAGIRFVAAGDGEALRGVLRQALHDGVLLLGHVVLLLGQE